MRKREEMNRKLSYFHIFVISLILAAIGASFVCANPVDFVSKSPLGTLGVQEKEVAVGDLVTDAVKRAGGTQIVFMSASELKEVAADIPAGKVSSRKVIVLLSYPDDLVVVLRLIGSEIREALEKSVSAQPNRSLGFLQVAGLKFQFDPNAKSGGRVGQITVAGEPLVADRQYEVAMGRSLGNGALGYWRIWGKQNVVRETKIPFSQAVETFLATTKTVDYSGTNRIIKGS